jgi:hypothetical protein
MKTRLKRRKFRMGFSSRAFHQKDYARSAEIALLKRWGIIGPGPYHPFIPVRRLAGSGFSGRLICPYTGELIDCHSKGEINWARLLLWVEGHRRLFPQVALPRQATMRIAKEQKVIHPRYPDGTPAVMTTDFVHLTEQNGDLVYAAYAIKHSPEKLKKRKRQLLDIEEQYFLEKGIPWFLKYRYEANQDILYNIRAVDAYVGASPMIWGSDQWQKFEPSLFAKVSEGLPLHRACQAVEPKLKMKPRSALTLVRFFIANRIWRIDWSRRFDALAPLPIVQRCPEITL